MLRFVQVFMIYFSCYFGTSFSSGISNRISGEHYVNISIVPYQLALERLNGNEYENRCGAAVLSIEWAITAGHCVFGRPVQNIRLRGATSYILSGGRVHQAGNYVVHPSYNPTTLDYDIAVIKVTTHFLYDKRLQPIKLAHTAPPVGYHCIVSGWDQFYEGQPLPFELQAVMVDIIDENTCKCFYRDKISVTPRNLCVGITDVKQGICGGDPGGPLVANGELIGVQSPRFVCGEEPGVFTNVPVLREWITSITGVN